MPDRRRHRSAAPQDRALFGAARVPLLREATAQLSWLWSRGYGERASLKLVGDRFELTARERAALGRAACGSAERRARAARRAGSGELAGRTLLVDGFNVLTTVEVALGGGVVLLARDGCARDIASVRGTWRRVVETRPSLELIGVHLAGHDLGQCRWLLDAPVSNSGRLAALLGALARERGWPWRVDVVRDPDPLLVEADELVATADRAVLDRCGRWYNLAREVLDASGADVWSVDLA